MGLKFRGAPRLPVPKKHRAAEITSCLLYQKPTFQKNFLKSDRLETVALVRLRMSVHWRVEVPLWRCFPPRVESNCIAATRCGEQLETKG